MKCLANGSRSALASSSFGTINQRRNNSPPAISRMVLRLTECTDRVVSSALRETQVRSYAGAILSFAAVVPRYGAGASAICARHTLSLKQPPLVVGVFFFRQPSAIRAFGRLRVACDSFKSLVALRSNALVVGNGIASAGQRNRCKAR
jgi:hypothetical protein